MSKLQREIFETYSGKSEKKKEVKNMCSGSADKPFSLTESQKFLSKWYVPGPENQNGLLLYHSVGSGKTLTGISIMKNFEDSMNLLWVTRTTLKDDIEKALKMLPLKTKLTRLSYKQFSNVARSKNKMYLKGKDSEYLKDPFYNTLIIIDEAHKLFSKDLKPQEMHDMPSIIKAIDYSYYNSDKPCKIILMSATPVTKKPEEIIDLLNLIVKNKFTNDLLSKENEKIFSEKLQGLVSFLDVSKNKEKFAQVVKINKMNSYISTDTTRQSCKEVYDSCRKSGNTVIACTQVMDMCKKEMRRIKQETKDSVFQRETIQKRCGVNLAQ